MAGSSQEVEFKTLSIAYFQQKEMNRDSLHWSNLFACISSYEQLFLKTKSLLHREFGHYNQLKSNRIPVSADIYTCVTKAGSTKVGRWILI